MIFMTHRSCRESCACGARFQIQTKIVTFVVGDEKFILLHFNAVANGQDQNGGGTCSGLYCESNSKRICEAWIVLFLT